MDALPTIYIIRATDALQPTATLQEILRKLKMETRISDFVTLDIDDGISSLMNNMKDGDLILILLTYELESQKARTGNNFSAFKTNRSGVTVAEIIIDNIPYENIFITFPADLRPIRDRADMNAAWSTIEQSLKGMFPVKTIHQPEPETQPINKRLKAVENHPEYLALLEVKPSAAPLYGRFGCIAFFGVIFAAVAIFMMNAFSSEMDGSFQVVFFVLLLLFIAVGVGMTVWGIFRLIKLSGSKLTRPPALVVDKRIAVSGGGSHGSSASTHYYVTLELGDGERREFEARGKLYGKITKDDAGVAYIQDHFLLDYHRLAGI
jgi:Protein of unknown function (DUF2500)